MAQPEIVKDIEARVKKSGDTMTGSLTINHSWPTINLLDPNNPKAIFQVNPEANNVYLGMNNSGIIVGPSDLKYLDSNSVYQNIYHTGYKPNFEDVNAISNRWEDRYYIPSGSDLNIYFNSHPKYGGYCIASGNAINNPSTDTTWWWYFKTSIGKFASNLSTPNKLWWRWHINENYGPWNELLHSNNFSQYALPFIKHTTTLDFNTATQTGFHSVCVVNNTNTPHPGNHGLLIVDSDVGTDYQIWSPDNQMSLYKRWNSGGTWSAWSNTWEINISGNATSATKAAQDGNGNIIASTYRPLRRNICGQSEGTITNPWYKFASIIITGAYEDRTITFKVSQGYSDNAKMSGILTAHIRTTNPVGFENAQLIWEYANDSIVTSDWVLAYLSTSGTDCKVELWCKQDAAWSQYHFEVLSCHDRTGWRDDWVLYNTQSAGSASGPTSGYTQIKSVYGVLRASAVYGAVWNDYAEYRSSDPVEPGRVICETGNGTLKLSTERLQPGANVVSDTFGFAIGETENCKTPIAVSGRALVYTCEDRYSYAAGDPVCAGPGGTVSKMSREEVMMYPDRIVGTVSEIPEYERWGTGNVEVKNRIWIKVK